MAKPTRYRDLEGPSLIDVGARSTSTGAADTASRLADTFAAFSKVGSEVGSQLSANLGSKQGTAEGLAGAPTFKKGVRANTAFGRAYNSAAETGYVAQAQTDIDATMTRLEQESEADEAGFSAKANAYAEGMLAEAPEEIRPVLQHVVAARSSAGANRVRAQQIAKERTQAYADYLASAPAVMRNTVAAATELPPEQADEALMLAVEDNKARLDALVKDNVIGADAAVRLGVQFRDDLDKGLVAARTDGEIQGLMNYARDDVQLGDMALAAIEGRTDLSPADKTAIRNGYQEQRNLLDFERSRQFAEASGDFAGRLAGGAFGPDAHAENLNLYKAAGISVDEYQSNEATIQRNSEKKSEDGVDIAAILAAMNGTGPGLDPLGNTKQREALDKLFQAETAGAGMAVGDPRWQARAVQIAKRTNILPASAQSWARVNMMSGDPAQVAEGATFFARSQESNPVAWDYDADPKIAAFAEQINANLAAGVVTERALEMAQKNVYEMSDNERQIVAQRYRDDKIVEGNQASLLSALNADKEFDPTVLGSSPSPNLAMQAEYNGMVERMYNYTNGDAEAARKLAYDAIKSRYGRTTMNGSPEVVKYAPEKMYPGLTADVIRNDVAATIRSLGAPELPTDGLTTSGNINLATRPVVNNADGSISTVSSMSIGTDQGEVLIPMVSGDGRKLSKDEAVAEYRRTGQHLGVFASPEAATKYAEALHQQQAAAYSVDPSTVRLTPVPATERTKGRVWMLQAPDEYGVPDVVRDQNNQPVLYTLPLGNEFNVARERLTQERLANAQREREQREADKLEYLNRLSERLPGSPGARRMAERGTEFHAPN